MAYNKLMIKKAYDLSNQVLSVSEFNELIEEIISPLEVVVKGELSEVNISRNKWFFATLKDDKASVKLFSVLNLLPNWQVLKEGMKVKVFGHPRLYQKSGSFSIFAQTIIPAGRGDLRAALEELKKELTKAGYFEESRRRPLPDFVQRIGLITAKDSRAYSDFVKIINRRQSGLKVDFYPVLVQGEHAVASIKKAFSFFNKRAGDYDLIVLTRGGGSLEDLFVFNSRQLVEMIYASRIPVLVGIGHEADQCLVDLAADIRTPTPTAAANVINLSYDKKIEEINYFQREIIVDYKIKVTATKEKVDYLANQLCWQMKEKISQMREERRQFFATLAFFKERILRRKRQVIHIEDLLYNLDYRHILKRGFSLTFNEYDKIIKKTSDLTKNQLIKTVFSQGEAYSQIKKMKND